MIETSKNMNDLITLLSRVKRHFQFSLNCYKRQGRRGRWGGGVGGLQHETHFRSQTCMVLGAAVDQGRYTTVLGSRYKVKGVISQKLFNVSVGLKPDQNFMWFCCKWSNPPSIPQSIPFYGEKYTMYKALLCNRVFLLFIEPAVEHYIHWTDLVIFFICSICKAVHGWDRCWQRRSPSSLDISTTPWCHLNFS